MTHVKCTIPVAMVAGALLLAAPAALGQQSGAAAAPTELRIYDVSDLALADGAPGAQGAEAMRVAEELAIRMLDTWWFLSPDLLAIEATPESAQRFENAMETLRAMHRERVRIRLTLRAVGEGPMPTVGRPLPEGGGHTMLRMIERVAPRRRTVSAGSTTTHAYIGDSQPVVGGQSSAYDPQIEEVTEGLALRVHVAPERDGGSLVTVSGTMTSVGFRDVAMPEGGTLSNGMMLQIPRVGVRSIESTLTVPAGRETAVAVFDDAQEPGRLLALTVLIEPAP